MEDTNIHRYVLQKLQQKGRVKLKEFIEELVKETNKPEDYIYHIVWYLRKAGIIGWETKRQ